MATQNKQKTASQQVTPAMIAAAVILLVIVISFYGYKTLRGYQPEAAPVSAEKKADSDWLVQKANESQGVMSKLSKDDQEKLQTITKGYGGMSLSQVYASQQKK